MVIELYLNRFGFWVGSILGFTDTLFDFLHTEHFILVDKTQRIRGIYNGTLQLEVEQLINDIQNLLNE